jgi:hypothetical protein
LEPVEMLELTDPVEVAVAIRFFRLLLLLAVVVEAKKL